MQCYAKVNHSIREILQSFHVNLREFVDESYKILQQNHAIENVYLLSQTITDIFMAMHFLNMLDCIYVFTYVKVTLRFLLESSVRFQFTQMKL